MIQPSSRVGQGVKPAPVEPVIEQAPEAPEYTEAPVPEGRSIWHDKPTFSDQLLKYPKTCLLGPPQYITYNLSVPEDLAAFNALFAKSEPPAAPAIKIEEQQKEFSQTFSNWIFYVRFRLVQYKKLLPS